MHCALKSPPRLGDIGGSTQNDPLAVRCEPRDEESITKGEYEGQALKSIVALGEEHLLTGEYRGAQPLRGFGGIPQIQSPQDWDTVLLGYKV